MGFTKMQLFITRCIKLPNILIRKKVIKMAGVNIVSTAFLQHEQTVRRKFGRIFDTIGKYAVDFAANFSPKAHKGRLQLHKTVQEDLKDRASLKVCNDKGKPESLLRENKMQSETEENQGELNSAKYKIGIFSEKMEPMSSDELPLEHPQEKEFLIPNKRRIMIRSRL